MSSALRVRSKVKAGRRSRPQNKRLAVDQDCMHARPRSSIRRASMKHGPCIRSGGQSGVDRAALDAALSTGRPYHGWCPKDGWAEDFERPPGLLAKYPRLKETPSRLPEQRTEWNVRDSAATIILIPDASCVSPGVGFTIDCARKHRKPYRVLHCGDGCAIGEIIDAISQLGAEQSLNFASPRESECPGVYELCSDILKKAFAFQGPARLGGLGIGPARAP